MIVIVCTVETSLPTHRTYFLPSCSELVVVSHLLVLPGLGLAQESTRLRRPGCRNEMERDPTLDSLARLLAESDYKSPSCPRTIPTNEESFDFAR